MALNFANQMSTILALDKFRQLRGGDATADRIQPSLEPTNYTAISYVETFINITSQYTSTARFLSILGDRICC
jgi:hypothetical protein